MNEVLKQIAVKSASILPSSWIETGYRSISKVTERSFSSLGCKIIFRNSFHSRDLVGGISDLDMTLYFESHPSKRDISRLEKKYHRLKRCFPLLGEINLYSKEDLEPVF